MASVNTGNPYSQTFQGILSECDRISETLPVSRQDIGALTKKRGLGCVKATEPEWLQIGGIVVSLASAAIAMVGLHFLRIHIPTYLNPSTWTSCTTGGAAVGTLIAGGGLIAAGVAGVGFGAHTILYHSEKGREMLEKLGFKALGSMNPTVCDALKTKIKTKTLAQLHQDPDWRVRNLDIIVEAALLERETQPQQVTTPEEYKKVITLMAQYQAVHAQYTQRTAQLAQQKQLDRAGLVQTDFFPEEQQLNTAYEDTCAQLEKDFADAKATIWPPASAASDA